MLKFLFTVVVTHFLFQLAFTQTFEQECLEKHNEYRAMHSTPPLEIDSDITAVAQDWANRLASTGNILHRPNNNYGENIYAVFGAQSVNGSAPVTAWYDEIKDYDFNNPGFSMETGHFTALVWKNSKKVGCAKAQNGTSIYVVANYSPPGNVRGQYRENVLPLK